MKLLILTQYFPPEVGAPQNRLYELAVRLKEKGADVSVLTAMPNYPQMEIHKEYRGKCRHYEDMGGLKVHRSWIFVSKRKSILPRLLNYFSFVWSSFWSGWFRLGKFDYILCESPPLFLGISAYLLCKVKGARLIFNVSDLWPESAEKLGIVTNKSLLRIAYRLEHFLYKKAALITGQTQGIVKSIRDRFPEKRLHWLPNGVDLSYFNETAVDSDWRKPNGFSEEDFILFYAGIIGHAYKFEVILDAARALQDMQRIRFVIMGSGPEKSRIMAMKESMGLSNVFFFDTVPKSKLPSIIHATDAQVIPLRRTDLASGTIPSKIFENLAMKKPVLLGVEGEAKALFIDEGQCGLFFEPENARDLAEKIMMLYSDRALLARLGENGRRYVADKFDRDRITADLWKFLNASILILYFCFVIPNT